jgi:hypothetical protein
MGTVCGFCVPRFVHDVSDDNELFPSRLNPGPFVQETITLLPLFWMESTGGPQDSATGFFHSKPYYGNNLLLPLPLGPHFPERSHVLARTYVGTPLCPRNP